MASDDLPVGQAIVLGLLHGPAELLPISSSGHMTLLPWLVGGKLDADPELSQAFEVLLHAGTAAALLMYISFSALMAAQVAFMRMFGVGLTLAILVDATLVRMLLVPVFMHVLGRVNWWAPKPLARLHERFGISESHDVAEIESPAAETGPRVNLRS